MKATEIKKEMDNLYKAMKCKLISVNDYCTMYNSLAQKLKKLNNN